MLEILLRLLPGATEFPGNITRKHTASHHQQHGIKATEADSSTEILPACCAYQLTMTNWMLICEKVFSLRRAGSETDATRKIDDPGKSLSILMGSECFQSHPAQNLRLKELRFAMHSEALHQVAPSQSKPMLEYIRSWRNDIFILMNCS